MSRQTNRARILAHIEAGDQSVAQVSAALSMANTTAWRWLRILRAEGAIHVCAINNTSNGGQAMVIYRAGMAPAMFEPPAQPKQTEAQRSTSYRKRMRDTGDWADVLARQRVYYWRHKPAARDPLTAAFFGAAV